jgi:AraC family transcriptional regulator
LRVRPGNFYGTTLRKLGVSGFSVVEARYAPGLRLERHVHERPFLSFVVAGRYVERYGRGRRTCDAGTALYHPVGEVHEDRFGRCGGWVISIELPERLSRAVPNRGTRRDPARDIALIRRLRELGRELHWGRGLALEAILFEIAALLSAVPAPTSPKPAWYYAAVDLLHDSFARSLSFTAVAAELGIHPVTLARGFRRYHGSSLGELVRTLRVNFAREELLRSAAPIAEVAQRAGFADQSHLCRLFKRQTGMTPSEFRAACA